MSSPARPLWHGRALALVGIVLFAFSLRSAVASLSPLFDHISAEFDVPAAVIGLMPVEAGGSIRFACGSAFVPNDSEARGAAELVRRQLAMAPSTTDMYEMAERSVLEDNAEEYAVNACENARGDRRTPALIIAGVGLVAAAAIGLVGSSWRRVDEE